MKIESNINIYFDLSKSRLRAKHSIVFSMFLSLLLLTPLVLYSPISSASETTTSKILDVTKRIISKAAKVGVNEAGTRILGSSWRYFEPVVDSIFDELEPKDENLSKLKTNNPGVDGERIARQVVEEISNNPKIKNLITNEFANLKRGQREIINRLSRIENVLLEQGDKISDFQKSSDEKLNYIISKIDRMERDRPGMNYTSGITMFDLEGIWTLVEKVPPTCSFTPGTYGLAIVPIDAFEATGNYSLVLEPTIIPSVSDNPVCMNPRMEETIGLYGTLLRIPISDEWYMAREVYISGNRMVLSWTDGDGQKLKWIFERSP